MIEIAKALGTARKSGWKSIGSRSPSAISGKGRRILFARRLPPGKYVDMDHPPSGGYLFTKFNGKRFWVCDSNGGPWKKRRVNR